MTLIFSPILPSIIFLVVGILSLGRDSSTGESKWRRCFDFFQVLNFLFLLLFPFDQYLEFKYIHTDNFLFLQIFTGLKLGLYYLEKKQGTEYNLKSIVSYFQEYVLVSLIFLVSIDTFSYLIGIFYFLRYQNFKDIQNYSLDKIIILVGVCSAAVLWLFSAGKPEYHAPSYIGFFFLVVFFFMNSTYSRLSHPQSFSSSLKPMLVNLLVMFFILTKYQEGAYAALESSYKFSLLFQVLILSLLIYLFIMFVKETRLLQGLTFAFTLFITSLTYLSFGWGGYGISLYEGLIVQCFTGIFMISAVYSRAKLPKSTRFSEFASDDNSKELIVHFGMVIGALMCSPFLSNKLMSYYSTDLLQNILRNTEQLGSESYLSLFGIYLVLIMWFVTIILLVNRSLSSYVSVYKFSLKNWAKLDSLVLVFLLLLGFYASNLYKYII